VLSDLLGQLNTDVVIDPPTNDVDPQFTLTKNCYGVPWISDIMRNIACDLTVSVDEDFTGYIMVQDVLTQLTGPIAPWPMAISSQAAGWQCFNTTYSNPNPMMCFISGQDLAALGNTSTVTANFIYYDSEAYDFSFENCGTVSTTTETNITSIDDFEEVANSNCVPIGGGDTNTGGNTGGSTGGGSNGEPPNDDPKFDISKECEKVVPLGNGQFALTCNITVNAPGAGPNETVVVEDIMSHAPNTMPSALPHQMSFDSNEPWAGLLNLGFPAWSKWYIHH